MEKDRQSLKDFTKITYPLENWRESFEEPEEDYAIIDDSKSEALTLDLSPIDPCKIIDNSSILMEAAEFLQPERRKDKRLNVPIPFKIKMEGEAYYREKTFTTLNISGGGLLFQYEEPLFTGNEFDIHIILDKDGEGIECRTKVIRSTEIEKGKAYNIEVAFVDLSPENKEKLLQVIFSYDITSLLKEMVSMKASDLHLSGSHRPTVRVDRSLKTLDHKVQTHNDIGRLISSLLTPKQIAEFNAKKELVFSKTIQGVGRFRISVYQQRGGIEASFRAIPPIKTIEELGLPSYVKEMCKKEAGLILVTGNSGSGKTTTIASMVDFINTTRKSVIVSLESPVEFLHTPKNSIVKHIEVGTDVPSFSVALERVLKQDADVVVVGEIPNPEVFYKLLNVAESGHLVIASFGIEGTTLALEHIIKMYPPKLWSFISRRIADSLIGVVSQRLIPKTQGGLHLITEVLKNTPRIKEALKAGAIERIDKEMEFHKEYGTKTLKESLDEVYLKETIEMIPIEIM